MAGRICASLPAPAVEILNLKKRNAGTKAMTGAEECGTLTGTQSK